MKKPSKGLSLLFSLAILFTLNTNAQIVVKVKPQKPKVLVLKPNKVKKGHIWRQGHWKWNKKQNKYVWTKAHWVKENKGHKWIAGHWDKGPKGHTWIPGHWNKVKVGPKKRHKHKHPH